MASILDIYRKDRSSLIGEVPVIGKGALTLKEIDTWLTDNPDAQYFRIENTGNLIDANPMGMINGREVSPTEYRSLLPYTGGGVAPVDPETAARTNSGLASAIVAQDSDRGNMRYLSYTQAQMMGVPGTRKSQGIAPPTIAINYEPGSFYGTNGLEYDKNDGMILSREEYGRFKEQVVAQDKSGFLKNPTKSPERRVDSPNVVDDLVFTQKQKPASKNTILSGAPDGLGAGGTILGG